MRLHPLSTSLLGYRSTATLYLITCVRHINRSSNPETATVEMVRLVVEPIARDQNNFWISIPVSVGRVRLAFSLIHTSRRCFRYIERRIATPDRFVLGCSIGFWAIKNHAHARSGYSICFIKRCACLKHMKNCLLPRRRIFRHHKSSVGPKSPSKNYYLLNRRAQKIIEFRPL